SAMPLARALELCPNGIYTRGNYKLYSEYSDKIMAIFSEYSPDVHQISIDEAFLDMTGSERLFGDPVDCAKKLKNDVFKKTGLTVSVGIASTNYIAKISSGLKKPDGLFVVPPGQEEDFMLSLPLEKVWGVGKKTLERLRAAGFNSTKDIRKHSIELLSGIFGQSQASFLYNIVRGIEPEGFLAESKSHSSGIESTYDYDLLEWDAIESALLSLSEQLMFRLLRENITGKTVCVKIRYDDFTTCSAQSTSGQNVTSVEDLFSRAMNVFRQKYQAGRGIRLLGISIQNAIDADSEKQKELFDFGENKRKDLEKAILKIEQKNPQIKIHKARLLKSPNKTKALLPLLFLFVLLRASPKNLFADDTKTIEASGSGPMVVGKDLPPEKESEGSKILDWHISDKQVEFIAQGYWDAKLKETLTATFGFGHNFSLSAGTPILAQQVDLTLSFFLDKHWYLQAAFADEFNKNTFAAGYTNGQGYLKELRIANRKVVFPSTYSVDDVNRGIGGGENQAPGISSSFADPDGKWTLDAAIRYDMLTARNKTYYGKNSVNDTNRAKSSFITGRLYVLPSFDSAAAIQDVYVESYGGNYVDSAGRKYKKLSTSDYLVVPSRKSLVLSASAGAGRKNGILPAVAITFSSAAALTNCFSELGNFGKNVSTQRGSGFLGDTQKCFGYIDDDENENRELSPNVASFSYGGKSGEIPIPDPSGALPASIDNCGFFGSLNNQRVLFVQHPAGFSPFCASFRYDLGINSADEVQVVHSQSGKAASLYSALVTDDDLAITEENFFSERRYYADVSCADATTNDYASAFIRFPFCRTSPGTYLGYSDTDDIVIRSRNYTPVKRFDIGTDAISGTVIVYKNNVIDSGAKYNAETGEVTISSSVGSGDKIYIVWYEDSKSFNSGSIAGAAGFKYNFTEKLSGDVSLAGRWTLPLEKKYAEASKSYFGYGTLASKVDYKGENLSAGNTISGTVENKNTSGFYKLLSFDDSATNTSYNPQNAGKNLPKNFAPRLNQRPSQAESFAQDLDRALNCSQAAQSGSADTAITGYKIPVQWIWTGASSMEWAANTIAISGAILPSASTFSVALKVPRTFSGDLYLQLGVNADENFESETKGSIPTWKISDSSAPDVLQAFNTNKTDWQIVKVALKDSDRAQCVQYKNARIVAVNSGAERSSGLVYFGPYEIATQGIWTIHDQNITVTSSQSRAINTGALRFNSSTNYAQEVNWSSTATQAPENSKITMYKYFTEADTSDYNEINMYFRFKYEGNSTVQASDSDYGMTFLMDTDSKNVSGMGKVCAFAAISKRALASFGDGRWRLLTIDKSDNSIKIDGFPIAASERILLLNDSIIPNRVKIDFNTSGQEFWNERGSFGIDEIYFSKTFARFIAQDKNYVEYKKEGVLLESQNGFPIFRDLKAKLSSNESLTFFEQKNKTTKGDISANASASFKAAQIAFDLNAARVAGSDYAISSASHSISSAEPILKTLDFTEEFNFDGDGKSAAKGNSAKLNFSKLGLPLIFSGLSKVESSEWALNAKNEEAAELRLGSDKGGWLLRLSDERNQKTLKSNGAEPLSTSNYFYTWLKASEKEFSTGDSVASKRKVGGKIENTFFLPWSGLAPKIDFATEENYSAAKNYYYSDKNTFTFSVPFKIQKNAFEFSWKKSNGAVQTTSKGGNYGDDFNALFISYNDRKYYFAAGPIYDLISWNLSENIHSNTKNLTQADSGQSEYYNGEYAFSFKRPIYADKRDFYIPTKVALAFSRDIRAAKTLSDTYQGKLTLGWTAFNIFGKNGSIPIAKWFEQDEYLSSFIAALKFPRANPSDISQTYTTYLQANFYITKDNVFKNGVELEFQDQNNFTAKATV
ncbi:MAG: DNA polymerase IV, partial [Treponema sp.]|nr:DNA polymerase IV [Treponema sp.]